MKTILLSLFLWIAFVCSVHAQTTIALIEYFKNLKQVDVTIAGQPYKFLFDTGGGETFISPEVAKQLGKQVYGNATSFRMSGEQFTHQKLDSVEMNMGGLSLFHPTVGVWDVMRILPEELPKVDGVLSLKSFQEKILTLDLQANRLIVETPASFKKQRNRMTLLPSRFANGLDGNELNVFIGVPFQQRTYWFLFDTGNISEVLLSHHTASAWGLQSDTVAQRIELNPIAIQLGNRKLVSKAAAGSIIYDGVLNYEVLSQSRITINFPEKQVWVH